MVPLTLRQFFGPNGLLPGIKVIVLSYEDRLLQLERLELWCRKATTWQQYRIALPIGLFLGTAAGLLAGLAPYPTLDEACQIITAQTKVQFGASLLPEEFSACPRTELDYATQSSSISSIACVLAVQLAQDRPQLKAGLDEIWHAYNSRTAQALEAPFPPATL